MKFKLFSGYSDDIERDINNWLTANPKIVVVHAASDTSGQAHNPKHHIYVFYEERVRS